MTSHLLISLFKYIWTCIHERKTFGTTLYICFVGISQISAIYPLTFHMQFYLLFFEATQWSCTSNCQQLFWFLITFLNIPSHCLLNLCSIPSEILMNFLLKVLWISDFFEEFPINFLWMPGPLFCSFWWNPWKQISNLRENPCEFLMKCLWISYVFEDFLVNFLRSSYAVLMQFLCGF